VDLELGQVTFDGTSVSATGAPRLLSGQVSVCAVLS